MDVIVSTSKDARETESRKIDWNNRSDRKWLESHLHWAMNNKRHVSLTSHIITLDSHTV